MPWWQHPAAWRKLLPGATSGLRRFGSPLKSAIAIFNFILGAPPSGGPGGGSGLPGNRWFWADSGPDPGGNIFNFCFGPKRSCARWLGGIIIGLLG